MWMGTYPELPAYVLSTGEDLQQILDANKEKLIGEPILKKFGTDLPFLPKVRGHLPRVKARLAFVIVYGVGCC